MKRLLSLGIALLVLLTAPAAWASWNADWPSRVRIDLNTAEGGVKLQAGADAVPVLVRLHTGNFSFVDAKPDGSDLRFVASDDKTPLKYHIEKFDGLNELALVWVQVPKLAANAKDQFVWLYYGNQKATPGDDARGSYDAAQGLVYHFGEKETTPQDVTANAVHALRSSATASAAGLIGGGLNFNGQGELVLPDAPAIRPGAGGFTVSMWIKPADAGEDAVLFQRQQGGATLSLELRGGKLVATAGGISTPMVDGLAAGSWQHVALVVNNGLAIYLQGEEAGRSAGTVPAVGGETRIGTGYKGELDELQIASTARSADWLKLAAQGQGPDQKLVVQGKSEGGGEGEGGSPSYFKILLGSVTLDGWVIIGILMVMMVISALVMVTKTLFILRTGKANARFKPLYKNLMAAVDPKAAEQNAAGVDDATAAAHGHSSLYHLYVAAVSEMKSRFVVYAKAGREPTLSAQSIDAIRATLDARLVREMQRLNSQIVLLTIAIAGGPFLGLLGTVVGVMITFAAIAAAGDVNVNAIAPGIAAALVATVAGLVVAIPSLFGYNYLASKIKELSSDMQVFVDELITSIAENHSI